MGPGNGLRICLQTETRILMRLFWSLESGRRPCLSWTANIIIQPPTLTWSNAAIFSLSLLCLSTVCTAFCFHCRCLLWSTCPSVAVHLWIRSFLLIARAQRLIKNEVSLSLSHCGADIVETSFIFIAEIKPWALVCQHLVIIAPKKTTSCYYRQSTRVDQCPRFP